MRYVYSIIRYVPWPATGEFVNVGAIAGSDENDDWDIRIAKNWMNIAAKLCADMNKIEVLEYTIRVIRECVKNGFSEDMLREFHKECRNLVQYSEPMPVVASSSKEALDLVFHDLVREE